MKLNTETAYTERLKKVEEQTRELLVRLPPIFLYHHSGHTLDSELGVASMANKISLLEKISYQERELIVTAAYLHDLGYLEQHHKNEAIGARMAGEILPGFGYTANEITEVGNMILATEVPTNPKNHLQEILCDADVDNLGRDDFFVQNENLRREIGIENKIAWYKGSIHFLEGHRFYTPSSRALRDEGKLRNLQELYALVGGRI